jgi:hypothetical protein
VHTYPRVFYFWELGFGSTGSYWSQEAGKQPVPIALRSLLTCAHIQTAPTF